MKTSGAALTRGNARALPLGDCTVDLIVTSPPYLGLRTYVDGGEHYHGQIGSEEDPDAFLDALWAVLDECWRVLKPGGSCWVNLGDKYAGGGDTGGLNDFIPSRGKVPRQVRRSGPVAGGGPSQLQGRSQRAVPVQQRRNTNGSTGTLKTKSGGYALPDGQRDLPPLAVDTRNKSLLGLPWRFALGATCPAKYRHRLLRPDDCWHDDGGPSCLTCRPAHPRWILRAEVLWSKPNGLPESVSDRVRKTHEQWFHLTKAPRYYSAVDEIRERTGRELPWAVWAANTGPGKSWHDHSADAVRGMHVTDRQPKDKGAHPLGRLPGSVWTVATEPLRGIPADLGEHYAAFPSELPRRIILGWSPSGVCTACGEGRRPVIDKRYLSEGDPYGGGDDPTKGRHRLTKRAGDGEIVDIVGYACACPDTSAPTRPAVVLDPFAGTGTTLLVARALGRFGIGVDLSADYLRLARWRVFRSGHGAKALARTHRERQGVLL